MALGALTSVALLIAALLDFGDPMVTAKLEIEGGASTRADLVEARFGEILGAEDDPAPALGAVVEIHPEPLAAEAPDTEQGASDRFVGVLIESALFEAADGQIDAAVAQMEDALARGPADPRAEEARLHLARWCRLRGDDAGVLAQRRALVGEHPEDYLPRCLIDGTSAALLIALVEPVDPELGAELLRQPLLHLPVPTDTASLVDGRLELQGDPWWDVIQGRFAAAAPDLAPWDELFLRERRFGDAARELFEGLPGPDGQAGGVLETRRGAWLPQLRGGSLILARMTDQLTRAFVAAPTDLANTLRGSPDQDQPDSFEVAFACEPESPLQAVSGQRALGNIPGLSFTIRRDDPYRAGRRELMQLRFVRAGLVLLALAILATSIMSARATDRARKLTALRSTFVASVSHDLRTPIQSVLLMAETLEQNRVATEASRFRYFASIRREAHRLRRLVEDLLDGARIDRGEGARVERREVHVERYFDELETAMRERAERADGALTVERGALPETLLFDPDGVHRALWNLLENALKYGRVGEETARIQLAIHFEDDVLCCTVSDEGPGIPARFAEAVFSPFERVRLGEDEEIEKDTGTGLGLSIVRAISRAHGGDTRLEPTTRGARFVATFPVAGMDGPTGSDGDRVA